MAQAIVPATTETFNDIPIHIYEHEGKRWIAGCDLGRALGMSNHRTGMSSIFTRHKDELTPHTTDCVLQSVDGKARRHKVYDEPGAYLVTMFANTDRAKEVRLWLANLPRLLREQQPQPALPSSPALSTVADRRPLA
ncbi:MAG: hypothetical protein PWQ57_3282 [Desulfovibrionales bacterium]|nr:hypothetical protein [Desulfovibrionales bacterium]